MALRSVVPVAVLAYLTRYSLALACSAFLFVRHKRATKDLIGRHDRFGAVIAASAFQVSHLLMLAALMTRPRAKPSGLALWAETTGVDHAKSS